MARDIKALSIPINDDRVYKQFKKNLDKAIAEYDEIIQIYNVIVGLGKLVCGWNGGHVAEDYMCLRKYKWIDTSR